ncbi:shikimate dehydrogenase [Paractinoplanes atraurantiacus]|uniref:Shikimate dehydrogenase n=1 Tax=Paractinoplanes atraurantiacus TaxID=1036182 RepID=A0A285J8H0_9ACTN|nr:shikimate dehydrogenase [Actinoplanes atraurantiacus]SNY56147.1 shikimate dehydrogenase [Actinoplanes atraurantiacus]
MQRPRRAAVCGKPIAHSLSPVIHTAGFQAAGLTNWRYTSFEVDELGLPELVDSLGPEWAGLSLTMPLKETALRLAAEASPLAVATGAANTLVRREDGSWYADNTDATGMIRVLREAGAVAPRSLTVLGGGGTARAALAAAASLGVPEVAVVTRRSSAQLELAPAAEALGVRLVGRAWEDAAAALTADAVISTVPKGAADHLAIEAEWRPGTVLFDAIYDPWPTPLAASAVARGLAVISGLDLLLAQAYSQFTQFTKVSPAPETAMREALFTAAAAR